MMQPARRKRGAVVTRREFLRIQSYLPERGAPLAGGAAVVLASTYVLMRKDARLAEAGHGRAAVRLPAPASPSQGRANAGLKVDRERGLRVADSRRHTLTGRHAVLLRSGTVLRFFLAGSKASDSVGGWTAATHTEFQHAYEISLFDSDELKRGRLRPNPRRVCLALDAQAGTGSFYWSDGSGAAGIMTANGRTPKECGLCFAETRRNSGGVS